jgi:hypothetical protein
MTVGSNWITTIQFNLKHNYFINSQNINIHNISSLINMLLHREHINKKKRYFLSFVFPFYSFRGLEGLVVY